MTEFRWMRIFNSFELLRFIIRIIRRVINRILIAHDRAEDSAEEFEQCGIGYPARSRMVRTIRDTTRSFSGVRCTRTADYHEFSCRVWKIHGAHATRPAPAAFAGINAAAACRISRPQRSSADRKPTIISMILIQNIKRALEEPYLMTIKNK